MDFRWNDWNTEHIERHGVRPDEAEEVALNARHPYPLYRDDGKWLVWGRTGGGRMLQVVYVLDEEYRVFVIHARPLTGNEKRHYRRRSNP